MSEKSDIELQNITSESSPYTNDAIKAALGEIKRRLNQNTKKPIHEIENVVSEKIELLNNKELKQAENYSYFESEKYIFDDPKLPELYTKNFILFISFFIGIIFGSIFLMINLRTIGLRQKGYFVLTFGILITLLNIILFYFFNNTFTLFILNIIGLLLINGYFWDNYIGKKFRHRRKKIIFV